MTVCEVNAHETIVQHLPKISGALVRIADLLERQVSLMERECASADREMADGMKTLTKERIMNKYTAQIYEMTDREKRLAKKIRREEILDVVAFVPGVLVVAAFIMLLILM